MSALCHKATLSGAAATPEIYAAKPSTRDMIVLLPLTRHLARNPSFARLPLFAFRRTMLRTLHLLVIGNAVVSVNVNVYTHQH
jgi:hypothetical protein